MTNSISNKLDTALAGLKKSKKTGLMTHLVLGYPSRERAIRLAAELEEGGATILELQIPFSDPIADGPTIMKACDVSLKSGTTVHTALEDIAAISRAATIPVVVMSYYNPIFAFGAEAFCQKIAAMGVTGLIVPDLPPEEEANEGFLAACNRHSLHAIRVVSPASTYQRLRLNADIASGFVYTTSRFGVTGAKADLDPRLIGYLDRLRTIFRVPIAVGFGISKPEHVRAIHGHADVVIVGSAIIDFLHPSGDNSTNRNIPAFIHSLLSR
ncbi:MAG: tryptophan synthase subunit alpha [Patescibacteria group bacterium]|nr:tryptophan synthase subunit alpha [Patescibacteria group bacterium]